MAYNNDKMKKAKMDKNQPLPKGDKYHYYPKGPHTKGEGYPDTPSEIQECQNRNTKKLNADQYGMRN